ncbi:alpha-1,2-mannosyltransferase [Cellulomonas sp. URHB0016]
MNARDAPTVSPPARAVARCVAAGAALLAILVRWSALGGASGLYGYHGYDDGVYFASAVAFVHDRLPYRDFLLLHPPGIMLALAPFALLTRWLSDSEALAAARLGFVCLGAINTILVTRLARRWGTSAMVVAGLLYAVSSAAAYAERLTLLEPLGTLTLLASVLLLLRARVAGATSWWLCAGGVVLGLGPVVKIWNVVPVVVVIAWVGVTRGWRSVALVAGAATASAAAVLLPFAIAAPSRMFRLVILDQLGRPRTPGSVVLRLEGITGVDVTAAAPIAAQTALAALVCAAVTAAAIVTWVHRRARLWVVLLGTQVLVILVSPSFYAHYSAYSAAALSVVTAAAVSLVPASRRPAVAVAAGALFALTAAAVPVHPVPAFPAAAVRGLLPATGCIRSDSPGALALLDVLTRDVVRRCDVPVDVSGQTYDVGSRDAAGRPVPRIRNQRWQAAATTYLTSGSATIMVRGVGDGFDAATLRALQSQMTTERLHGVRLLLPRRPDPEDRSFTRDGVAEPWPAACPRPRWCPIRAPSGGRPVPFDAPSGRWVVQQSAGWGMSVQRPLTRWERRSWTSKGAPVMVVWAVPVMSRQMLVPSTR